LISQSRGLGDVYKRQVLSQSMEEKLFQVGTIKQLHNFIMLAQTMHSRIMCMVVNKKVVL
jgi:hypothetical protein